VLHSNLITARKKLVLSGQLSGFEIRSRISSLSMIDGDYLNIPSEFTKIIALEREFA